MPADKDGKSASIEIGARRKVREMWHRLSAVPDLLLHKEPSFVSNKTMENAAKLYQ